MHRSGPRCPLSQLWAGLWSFSASVLLTFQTGSFFGGGGELLCTPWHLCPLPTGCQQQSFPHISDSPKCLQSSNIPERHNGPRWEPWRWSHSHELCPSGSHPTCYPRISASTQVSSHWLVLTGTPVTTGICLLPHGLFPQTIRLGWLYRSWGHLPAPTSTPGVSAVAPQMGGEFSHSLAGWAMILPLPQCGSRDPEYLAYCVLWGHRCRKARWYSEVEEWLPPFCFQLRGRRTSKRSNCLSGDVTELHLIRRKALGRLAQST